MIHYKRALVFLFLFASATVTQAADYRILITNDDGIESPLLIALTEALRKDYQVVVSAPRENQSGSSHASSSSTPLKVEKISRDNAFFGYGVHGRPADAARFGILQLGKDQPFDVVISGINRGSNVGKVSHLSGTVGAAMEGLYHGLPAIAVSQDVRANTELSIQLTKQVVEHFQQHGALQGTLISINVPAGDVKEVVVKPMGGSYLGFRPFQVIEDEGEDNITTYQGGWAVASTDENDNDTRAYQQGKATITPLKLDWTDYQSLKTIQQWDLKVSP